MKLITKNSNTENLPSDNKPDKPVINESHTFFTDLQLMLRDKKVEASVPAITPCSKSQCMYVLNFKTREMISSMGVEEMLGYEENEFNFNNLVNYVHPEDIDALTAVMYAVVDYVTENQTIRELSLSVTYRVRKKNGNYIKVLRQTSIGRHKYDPQAIYHNNVLTDISFMKSCSAVEWTFDAPDFNSDNIKMYVPQSNAQFFSAREREVLDLIDKGYTSNAIAKALFISKHTVDTHRRKMLQKTGSSNAIALLEFYKSHML
jgi:DNA-binding CsgD family transcriptional regulator